MQHAFLFFKFCGIGIYLAIYNWHLHTTAFVHTVWQDPCSTCDQFLVRGSLLTKKLMSQGFHMSRLQAAFRKFYSRYNDLIYPYNLSLDHMLSDMFHNIR
jgi:hypothetical protein